MATTFTVGSSGRTYSTLALALAAVPATPTGGYILELYNDSEFSDGAVVTGFTTSAPNNIVVRAATGQSFQDHASVRSNALIYDQSKGVGIRRTAGFHTEPVLGTNVDYVTFERLQVQRSTISSYNVPIVNVAAGLTNVIVRDCIIAKTYSGTDAPAVAMRQGTLINCLVYDTGATVPTGLVTFNSGGVCLNVTVARSGSAAGTGIVTTYSTTAINNTAVLGFTTSTSATGGGTISGANNATTSAAMGGTSPLLNRTYANEVESTTADYRLKLGSTLIGAGNTDATNAPNDISGYARGASTAGDIGAWEYTSAVTVTGGQLSRMLLGIG